MAEPLNSGYNKILKPYANKLRKEMTKAEACLWKYGLKAGMMQGYKFRRQRPVSNFIADFMCVDLKQIIEVDGITHHWEETMIKDEIREKQLTAAGFTVIRFTDDEVLNHINQVLDRIRAIINVLEASSSLSPKKHSEM
jgi:very-short-patch-repair endonuclease